MIKMLHKVGVRSTLMYTAGIASVGLAIAAWSASRQLEEAGLDRADHWGIFIGEWAPTFFAMGVALRMEEMRDRAVAGVRGHRSESDAWVAAHAPASATM